MRTPVPGVWMLTEENVFDADGHAFTMVIAHLKQCPSLDRTGKCTCKRVMVGRWADERQEN
jgi:hypothetical protein